MLAHVLRRKSYINKCINGLSITLASQCRCKGIYRVNLSQVASASVTEETLTPRLLLDANNSGDNILSMINDCNDAITICNAIICIGDKGISSSRKREMEYVLKCYHNLLVNGQDVDAARIVGVINGIYRLSMEIPWFFNSMSNILIDRLDELHLSHLAAIAHIYSENNSPVNLTLLTKLSLNFNERLSVRESVSSSPPMDHIASILLSLSQSGLTTSHLFYHMHRIVLKQWEMRSNKVKSAVYFSSPYTTRCLLESIMNHYKLHSHSVRGGQLHDHGLMSIIEEIIASYHKKWLKPNAPVFRYEIIRLITCMERLEMKVPEQCYNYISMNSLEGSYKRSGNLLHNLIVNSTSSYELLNYYETYQSLISPVTYAEGLDTLSTLEISTDTSFAETFTKFLLGCERHFQVLNLNQVVNIFHVSNQFGILCLSDSLISKCHDKIQASREAGIFLSSKDIIKILSYYGNSTDMHSRDFTFISLLSDITRARITSFQREDILTTTTFFSKTQTDTVELMEAIATQSISIKKTLSLRDIYTLLNSFLYTSRISSFPHLVHELANEVQTRNDELILDKDLRMSLSSLFSLIGTNGLELKDKSIPLLADKVHGMSIQDLIQEISVSPSEIIFDSKTIAALDQKFVENLPYFDEYPDKVESVIQIYARDGCKKDLLFMKDALNLVVKDVTKFSPQCLYSVLNYSEFSHKYTDLVNACMDKIDAFEPNEYLAKLVSTLILRSDNKENSRLFTVAHKIQHYFTAEELYSIYVAQQKSKVLLPNQNLWTEKSEIIDSNRMDFLKDKRELVYQQLVQCESQSDILNLYNTSSEYFGQSHITKGMFMLGTFCAPPLNESEDKLRNKFLIQAMSMIDSLDVQALGILVIGVGKFHYKGIHQSVLSMRHEMLEQAAISVKNRKNLLDSRSLASLSFSFAQADYFPSTLQQIFDEVVQSKVSDLCPSEVAVIAKTFGKTNETFLHKIDSSFDLLKKRIKVLGVEAFQLEEIVHILWSFNRTLKRDSEVFQMFGNYLKDKKDLDMMDKHSLIKISYSFGIWNRKHELTKCIVNRFTSNVSISSPKEVYLLSMLTWTCLATGNLSIVEKLETSIKQFLEKEAFNPLNVNTIISGYGIAAMKIEPNLHGLLEAYLIKKKKHFTFKEYCELLFTLSNQTFDNQFSKSLEVELARQIMLICNTFTLGGNMDLNLLIKATWAIDKIEAHFRSDQGSIHRLNKFRLGLRKQLLKFRNDGHVFVYIIRNFQNANIYLNGRYPVLEYAMTSDKNENKKFLNLIIHDFIQSASSMEDIMYYLLSAKDITRHNMNILQLDLIMDKIVEFRDREKEDYCESNLLSELLEGAITKKILWTNALNDINVVEVEKKELNNVVFKSIEQGFTLPSLSSYIWENIDIVVFEQLKHSPSRLEDNKLMKKIENIITSGFENKAIKNVSWLLTTEKVDKLMLRKICSTTIFNSLSSIFKSKDFSQMLTMKELCNVIELYGYESNEARDVLYAVMEPISKSFGTLSPSQQVSIIINFTKSEYWLLLHESRKSPNQFPVSPFLLYQMLAGVFKEVYLGMKNDSNNKAVYSPLEISQLLWAVNKFGIEVSIYGPEVSILFKKQLQSMDKDELKRLIEELSNGEMYDSEIKQVLEIGNKDEDCFQSG